MFETTTCDVAATLVPARRSLGLAGLRRSLLQGIGLGASLAAVILATSHFWPVARVGNVGLLILWPTALVAAGALVGIVVGLRRWPGLTRAARSADRHFALHDRLTTALQFQSSDDTLPRLQRAEMAHRVKDLALRQTRADEIPLREWGRAASTLAACAVLLSIGVSTRSGPAPSTGADRTRIRQAALVAMPIIVRGVDKGAAKQASEDPAQRQLDLQLALLRHRLLVASTRVDALRAVSLTQQQLHRIASALRPVDPRSVLRLNGALRRYQPLGAARDRTTAASDPLVAAQTLNRLVSSLPGLSAAQRAQLARTLAQAANTSFDKRLRSTLRQAASALANRDVTTASRALERAASFLTNTPPAQLVKSRLKTAGKQLDGLKNTISGLPKDTRNQRQRNGSNSPGRPGSGPNGGSRSGGRGAGNQRNIGSARSGGVGGSFLFRPNTGPAQGVAQGGRSPNTTGGVPGFTRVNGEGGRVAEDTGFGNNNGRRGKSATVYVPGAQGKGAHAFQLGPAGTVQQGAFIPYREVFVRYAHSAHTALERVTLPPALQQYVRQYFSAISQ